VQKVLQRTDRLPAMDEKLDMVLQGLGVIDAKIDQLLKFMERRSKKDARHEKRNDILSHYAIARDKIKLDAEPFASGGSCLVYAGRFHNQEVAVKVIHLSKRSSSNRSFPLRLKPSIFDHEPSRLEPQVTLNAWPSALSPHSPTLNPQSRPNPPPYTLNPKP